jgi:RNA polymerase sigma-54 factor
MQLQVSNQVGQRQSLVVTAQLQQAIHLLQMGNNDLQSYIEKEAEENPFVDVKLGKTEASASTDRIREQRLPSAGASDDFDYIGTRVASAAPSLYEHVAGQFDMMFDTIEERALAEQFLESIEPSGWLGESLENIAAHNFISEDEAEHMLFRVQQVEPAGLFARNLAECLALQAEDKGILSHRFQIILENLPMLANADLKGLSRVCKCSMDELKVELRNIRSLNPKPGADFDMSDTVQRAPDLLVSKGETGWLVDLNRSTLPSVVVDEKKAATFGKADDEGSYVGERLSVARWLRRAVEHRNMTTIKVGAEVVRRQSDFLEKVRRSSSQ